MTHAEATVLEILSDGSERYGIDLVRCSDGVLKRGTVYLVLLAMKLDGLVSSRVEDPVTVPYLPRHLYRSTPDGRLALAAFRRGALKPQPG